MEHVCHTSLKYLQSPLLYVREKTLSVFSAVIKSVGLFVMFYTTCKVLRNTVWYVSPSQGTQNRIKTISVWIIQNTLSSTAFIYDLYTLGKKIMNKYLWYFYSDANCAWLIQAPTPQQKVIVNIEDLDVEGLDKACSYDYVALYDGGSDSCRLVWQCHFFDVFNKSKLPDQFLLNILLKFVFNVMTCM